VEELADNDTNLLVGVQDHGAKTIPYPKLEEEDMQMPIAAEEMY
jgi:hypothetical protein